MLSGATKYKLYLLLKAVSENETMVEEQRCQLGLLETFEPYSAFRRILLSSENPADNAISPSDFCKFLRDNQVDYIKETDFFQMFEMFDADKDGNMNYEDWLQFVLPYNDMKLRAKISQREPRDCSGCLPADVEFELSRLIEKEIHLHQKVEDEKRTLER
jgi:hypothetical protein